jgi:hypothetical protein
MVVDCLVRVARRASFAPPNGDGSITVPLKFRSDRAPREAGAQPTASASSRHD